VQIENQGNGPSRIHIDAEQPERGGFGLINAGGDLRLESRAGGGASALYKATRDIEVVAPTQAGVYTFNAIFHTRFDGIADGALAEEKQTVSFSVEVLDSAASPASVHPSADAGSPATLPGLGAFGALAALGVAAWRRR
jgi:hypothetical protein